MAAPAAVAAVLTLAVLVACWHAGWWLQHNARHALAAEGTRLLRCGEAAAARGAARPRAQGMALHRAPARAQRAT
jgi:hypothetical protein